MDLNQDQPTFEVKQMSPTGLLTIRFSEQMIIPAKAEEKINADVLSIGIDPEEETFTSSLGFEWETVSFSDREIQI